MIQPHPPQSETNASSERFLVPLTLLFVGSGCAALVYEVIWFQMLQLVIGSTGISLGVLLGAFMGGMCIGSLALPKYVSRKRHPLRVYAALELAIGGFGIALLLLIPLVGSAYVAVAPSGSASVFLRALLAGVLLLPPTMLMGATLPAISRYVQATPAGVSWMGFFYGGNIAGAVLGCLVAGFYLLRQYDIVVGTFAAVALNGMVAALAYALSRFTSNQALERTVVEPPKVTEGPHRVVLIAIGLSGFVALGSEVVWTRLMGLMLGGTTYTFSIILAVFLAALGLGSGLGAYVSRHTPNARLLFGACQAGAVLGIAWTAYAIAEQLPFWPINPSIAYEPGFVFQLDLARAIWALAPAPFFWGASFPLAVAASAEKGQDPGALVGRVYAANTIGAILGALGFAVVAIPWLGTQDAQRALIGFAFVSAVLLLAPAFGGQTVGMLGRAVVGLILAVTLARGVEAIPPVLIAYGRYAPTYDPPETLYVGEGRSSSIAVTELANGVLNLHISGKVVASTEPQDMRLQGMLGHLTALLHDEPKSVLVVGFGAGVTAGTFVTHPSVERIVIAEIEPLIIRESSAYFVDANNDVLSDPRVEVVYDDARHFLLTTDEKFDLITSDPIHPWMKGAAALYSQEYFELAREHLNEGGVITQWVPLYESTLEAVKSEMVTFFRAFPEGTVWGNTYDGGGYDVVMAAKKGGGQIDVDAFVDRLGSSDHSEVAMHLSEIGFSRAMDVLSTYAAGAGDLAEWLADAEVNRDRSLRLMYLAGLGLNNYTAAEIYSELLSFRSFPEELFVGSEGRLALLRDLMAFTR